MFKSNQKTKREEGREGQSISTESMTCQSFLSIFNDLTLTVTLDPGTKSAFTDKDSEDEVGNGPQ